MGLSQINLGKFLKRYNKKNYLVGLAIGGVMEHPDFEYKNIETIEASSPREAEEIYNKKHNCSYWYAKCLGIALENKS